MMKKDKDIKMLSLDTSTKCTGYTEWFNDKYIESSILETNSKVKGDEKLNEMINLVFSLLNYKKPDIVLVEMVIPIRNANTTRMLQELTGSIRGFCLEHHITYVTLRPTEYRSIVSHIFNYKPVGRKRADQKAWALDIVNNKLGIKTDSDDEADSILLGKGYIHMTGGDKF